MAEKESDVGNVDAKPIALEEPVTLSDTPDHAEPENFLPPERDLSPQPVKRGSSWLALALGGAIAAAAGYGVAQYVPKGWPIQDTSALQAALDAQTQQIADLQTQIAELATKQTGGDLAERLAAVEAAQDYALSQIKEVQSRPPAGRADPALAEELAAVKDQLSKLQTAAAPDTSAADAMLKEAQAAAETIRAEAEATAKKSEQRAALGRVQAALDSGVAYGSALTVLGDVPAVLKDNADKGVPSLSALQNTFPAAARAALDAGIRSDMGDSWTERTMNFLRTQTGARSLTPSDGTDPDAVLSRAEAALAQNDLSGALTELATLPPESQAAMAEWRAIAEVRQAAIKAAADLAATIGE